MTETIKRLRFPRLRFPVPVVTTLALLVILAAVALSGTAQAQTAITLVSNIGQTSDATLATGQGDSLAQTFTVASGGGNYTLTSIEAPIVLTNLTALTAEDRALFSASLWSVDADFIPDSSLQALTNPSSISDGDTAAFTDPAGTTLEAGKSYAVVFVYEKNATELSIKAVGSASEDGTSLTGWSIRNSSRYLDSGDTEWFSDSNSIQIRVNGTAASGDTPACTLNEGDIWCGVMDVGTITNSGGATQSHGFQGTTGDLSDKMFSLMFETGTTNNYTIVAIVVGATTANSEQLYFVTSSSLTDTEVESLALHVDGESDPFVWSDSTEVITGSYRWPARTDLDWSSETTVTLRLREFPRPTVTNVEVTSTPVLETDTYGAGETIEVSVTFSEAVDATSDTDFVLSVAGGKRAPLVSGSGTATLVFGYTVADDDADDNGIWIGDETGTLVGNRGGEPQAGAITSVATGAAANHRPCRARHAVGPQGGRHAFDRLGGGDLGPVAGDGHLRGGRDDPVHGDLQRPGGRGRGPGFGVPVRRQRGKTGRRRVGQRHDRAGLRLHGGVGRRRRQRPLHPGRV